MGSVLEGSLDFACHVVVSRKKRQMITATTTLRGQKHGAGYVRQWLRTSEPLWDTSLQESD